MPANAARARVPAPRTFPSAVQPAGCTAPSGLHSGRIHHPTKSLSHQALHNQARLPPAYLPRPPSSAGAGRRLGDLAPPAQAKLLRALEDRTITRLGETRPRPIDVRVVAATNRPLDALVAEGRFRADLLYRLQVPALELPLLRERREDIPARATHFVAEFDARHGPPPVSAISEPTRSGSTDRV